MNSHEDHERVFGLLAISTAAHVFVFIGLGFAPSPSEALLNRNLEFELIDKPQELETDESEREPEPEKAPEPEEPAKPKPVKTIHKKVSQPTPKSPPPPTDSPPPQTLQEPIEFPGITLTSEDGVGSWTTLTGSGKTFKGPVKVPSKKAMNPKGSINGVVGGTGNADSYKKKDLSRAPKQPRNMDQTLLRNYPLLAKKQGIEGYAIMRVRIMPDGRVAQVETVRETFEGFSKACEKTLKSERWQPKLNRLGRPVISSITYTCRFEVGY